MNCFGHVRGAFTGITTHKIDRFEQAHRRAIFLDEVDDTPMELQVKLQRVIQQEEIERENDSGPIQEDIRSIAATKGDILQKLNAGKFSQGLHYPLCESHTLPP